MRLIDSHCHVHFRAYQEDMHDVIQRALNQGISMITVGTQKDTSRMGLEVAEQYEGLWATVGLHPNHLSEQEFWDEDELPDPLQNSVNHIKTRTEVFDYPYYKNLARHPKCIGIGETGLDYYRFPEHADRDEIFKKQEETVRLHFDLATEMSLPVVIHCRDAYGPQAELIEEYIRAGKLEKRGVMHCFAGSLEEAERFIALGFKISFSGIITFPPRKADPLVHGVAPLQSVVQALPLESLLVETDAPYLTPIPHRGERNEPSYVQCTAQKIADLKQLSVEEVAQMTEQNTRMLFGI